MPPVTRAQVLESCLSILEFVAQQPDGKVTGATARSVDLAVAIGVPKEQHGTFGRRLSGLISDGFLEAGRLHERERNSLQITDKGLQRIQEIKALLMPKPA